MKELYLDGSFLIDSVKEKKANFSSIFKFDKMPNEFKHCKKDLYKWVNTLPYEGTIHLCS